MEILLAALVVTVATAPLVRRGLLRRGLLDVPNGRSSHSTPVPRSGGLACLAGAAGGLVVACLDHRPVPWAALSGAAVLAAVGFVDDRRSLGAGQRLASQAAVGIVAGAAIGGVWGGVAGALIVPVTVNAVNFMDGINGITGLNVVVWGVAALLLGNGGAVTVLGAVACGAALGFLPWNAPVARLFLGDTGSYFFGALIGIGVLQGVHDGVSPWVLAAPMALYLADTGVTLVRRALRGAPLMTAHRDHAYQRLVDGAQLPHLSVATATAGIATLVTAAWLLLPVPIAAAVTALALVAYLASPGPVRRLRARTHVPEDGTPG